MEKGKRYNMDLNTARQKHKEGEITFKELSLIFFENGTDEDRQEFWKSPVYDRPWVVEGFNESERNKMFGNRF
jgi:hypothetical protein